MTHITLAEALPQLGSDLQRRTARHIAERPGFSTTDRLMAEMFARPTGFDRARYAATKRSLSAALRRLQAIGFVRYDDGGWVR